MKVISNTVDFDSYVWDDPGDYPNAVAGGPLPSEAVCEFCGEMVLEAENEDDLKDFETIEDWFNDWVDGSRESPVSTPSGWYISWSFKQDGNRITATPCEATARDDDYYDDERPDDYYDY